MSALPHGLDPEPGSAAHGSAAPKCKRQTSKGSGIPTSLPWAANKAAKTWESIAELGKMENYNVLFGKQEKKEVSEPCFGFCRVP
jgi:hypothetical protein